MPKQSGQTSNWQPINKSPLPAQRCDESLVDAEEHLLNLQSAQNNFSILNDYTTKVEPTALTPKLLLPGADFLPVKYFPELTSEEAALRHRLELKVERALYKLAVGLTQLDGCKSDSAHSWLVRIWGDERKVEEASTDAKMALRELQARQLYRSTHQCFNQYVSERFCWSKEEIYPLV